MRYLIALMMILGIGYSQGVLSHAEHDKARFVASTGEDKGNCNNRFRPCKTVTYAAQHANKGDKILVAQGDYQIETEQDLLYFTGEVVPVLGGFNQVDQYQGQNPDTYLTSVSGVPVEYADKLSQQGFSVIRDTKAQTKLRFSSKGLSTSQLQTMQSQQRNVDCVDGTAEGFDCLNMSLLAHMPLDDFTESLTSKPDSASDIWGFIDLNTQKEYAIIAFQNGVSVVDVSEPTTPQIIGSITGISSTWRDIKVYQYFEHTTLRWVSYAYVTTEANEGLTIIDLNDLDNGISIVKRQTIDRTAHNIYISNLDYGLNIALANQQPAVHILGSDKFFGSFRTYSLSDPQTLSATYSLSSATANDYTHDAASVTINDARAQTDCVASSNDSCLVILDFNEGTMRLWDHTNQEQATEIGVGTYPNAAYTHSGWWSEDKQYVLVHDEIDEQRFGLNTTINIFDISSLTTPILVGTWQGPTRAIDHNGFVRGNRYYMSNYERGLTVLDITDPSNPSEVGFFDTYPVSNNAGFNGAWGVYPFLPSGNILVSDINSGLYILKDQSLDNDVGKLSFASEEFIVQEGNNIELIVNKTGTGATTVGYEIVPGSANLDDFELISGELTWSINDTSTKSIQITTHLDTSDEITESFFVRLFNPQNGATLTYPNIATVKLTDSFYQGQVVFTSDEFKVKETDATVMIPVARQGGSDSAIQVSYQLTAGTAQLNTDVMPSSGILSWQDGDSENKFIEISLVDDQDTEELENLILSLSADDPALLGTQSTLNIQIRDDESNQPPTATAPQDIEVNTRQTVTLTGSGSDPEEQAITYTWQQVSGANVSINNANNTQMSFSAPMTAGSLVFSFTVTDDFGETATANVNVNVVAPVQPTSNTSGGGSLSFWWLFSLLSIGLIRNRRFSVLNMHRQS